MQAPGSSEDHGFSFVERERLWRKLHPALLGSHRFHFRVNILHPPVVKVKVDKDAPQGIDLAALYLEGCLVHGPLLVARGDTKQATSWGCVVEGPGEVAHGRQGILVFRLAVFLATQMEQPALPEGPVIEPFAKDDIRLSLAHRRSSPISLLAESTSSPGW